MAALRRYSLVRPAGDGTVSVHRLVQAVTADQMPPELAKAWRQAAAAVIEAALPGPAAAGYLAGVRRVAAARPGGPAADSDGMAQIASYLGYSGSYVAARELSQGMLEERVRALGPEHPDTLTARGHLAYWTGMAGDAAGARDQYAALLPIRERVLGPEHPDTLSPAATSPAGPGRRGMRPGPATSSPRCCPSASGCSAPKHPDTLITRGNLARWTGEAGDAAGARDQYAALLPIRERVLGPEHPDTLITRTTSPTGPGGRGMRPGPATNSPRCCPSASRCWAPSTRTP